MRLAATSASNSLHIHFISLDFFLVFLLTAEMSNTSSSASEAEPAIVNPEWKTPQSTAVWQHERVIPFFNCFFLIQFKISVIFFQTLLYTRNNSIILNIIVEVTQGHSGRRHQRADALTAAAVFLTRFPCFTLKCRSCWRQRFLLQSIQKPSVSSLLLQKHAPALCDRSQSVPH